MKKYITKIGAIIVILALIGLVVPYPSNVQAGTLTSMSDTMSRLKISIDANHTIKFVTPSGVAATRTITITFATGFVLTDVDYTDMDLAEGNSNNCATATFTDKDLAGAASGATWGAAVSAQVVTFTSASGTITADRCVLIEIGTNATHQVAGDQAINNPGTPDSKTISFGGTFGDSGSLAVVIVSDEQVSITATVDPSLTFDLDTATTNTESAAPYSVALGIITTGAVATSDGSTINSIWVDLATNAVGGAAVTVLDVGSGSVAGLYSTSKTKNIASGTATLTAGTEGYGVCVKSATASSGTFQAVSPYNTGANCTYSAHSVGALSLTAASILNSNSDPLAGGRAEILVKAAISAITPAATDYADTYTFIATGTF